MRNPSKNTIKRLFKLYPKTLQYYQRIKPKSNKFELVKLLIEHLGYYEIGALGQTLPRLFIELDKGKITEKEFLNQLGKYYLKIGSVIATIGIITYGLIKSIIHSRKDS